jgi:hypothetical protein
MPVIAQRGIRWGLNPDGMTDVVLEAGRPVLAKDRAVAVIIAGRSERTV